MVKAELKKKKSKEITLLMEKGKQHFSLDLVKKVKQE